MISEIKVRWVGEEPLLMHRGELASPFDPAGREISRLSSKRKKTLEDHAQLAKAEWFGSLYLDVKLGIYIPTENVTKCIIEGARKRKLGKQTESSLFVRSLDGDVEAIKLLYPGCEKNTQKGERERMYDLSMEGNADFIYQKTLRVGQSRIVRTRPCFRIWALEFKARFDTEILEQSNLLDVMRISGNLLALGDWRPRFGTFRVEIIE